jgi:carbon starvation protein
MTTLIVVVGLALYILLYLTYGKKLEKRVVKVSEECQTPSECMFDGVDYVPARRSVLFGHHFASIAGAAPIIGPVIAMAWGWIPALLWVWFGNVFVGAVHDYLALMASVRYDGKSIQFVASDLITKRTGHLFYYLVFFMLILLIAAFGAVLGGIFVHNPDVPSAYVFKIIAALILGILMYRMRIHFVVATIIGVIMLIVALWVGTVLPISLGYSSWMVIMFFYIIIASAIPVDVLLQPRDYLNSWLLYFGLLIGGIGAIFSFHGFTAPAFTSFAPIISGGNPTPFWPAIPLIIACGSLSGFHALVGSGTTSKQLKTERDGLFIGYGGMLTEGFLSTLVIVAVAGFGLSLMQGADQTISASEWGQQYTAAMMGSYPKAAMFTNSYAHMVASSWLNFIPLSIVKVIAGLWVASFAMTTLDTCNRLARYTLGEIFLPLKNSNASLFNFLTNRWVASVIPAVIGIWLAWSGNFTVLWPSFGSANQLIASMALMTAATWVLKRQHVRTAMTIVPAYLLWITVTAAIIWFSAVVLPGTIKADPGTGITVMCIELVMLAMNIVFMIDFIKCSNKSEYQPASS